MRHQTLFAVVAVVGGCSVDSKEPDDFVLDRSAPRVEIVSPARGTIAGDVTHVLVTGTASDDSGVVASVTVNGVTATLGADGAWLARVPVAPGTTLLHAVAVDDEGNRGDRTRAIVAGPMVSLDRHVAQSIQANVSAQALLAIGHKTEAFVENGGLLMAAQDMNPVVDIGAGPDCLYGQASITSLTVGDSNVVTAPTNEGILVSAVLDDVRVGMHLQFAVSCVEGSRDIELSAEHVNVQGLLGVGVVDHELDIQFADPAVQVTGFDAQLPDVPETVVQMLRLDDAIGPVLGSLTERIVAPLATRTLSVLDDTRAVDVAGTRVDVDVAPTVISFTPEGGSIRLETSLRARDDRGAFVYVPSFVPVLEIKHGFELAIADDAANQLLTSLWSAKAFDTEINLQAGAYTDIAEMYDSVQLQLLLPPHVNASSRPLELTIGDWIATFKQGDVIATTVAIHATTQLYVGEDEVGKLHMKVSTPAVRVDLVGDGDWISQEQYDAIRAFAADRVVTMGSAAMAAVPLPVIGDATTNLWVEPNAGYMLVAGDVQ